MNATPESWFLTVFARIETGPEWEKFDGFYQTHLPRLCSTPPYPWARRYYSRPPAGATAMAHFAIYGFVGRENLEPYLGPHGENTPALIAPELDGFAALRGVSDVSVITFDQTSGPDFNHLMDIEEPLTVLWSQTPTTGSADPGSMRFEKFDDPALAHHPGTDRYMSVAPLGRGDSLEGTSQCEHLYPIAKHWAPW
jgi:hypothetical protein